jgi:cell division septum initiation protein DivIVA
MLSDESTAKFEIELVNKQVQKIKQAKKDCQTHYGKQLGCGTCKALQLCMWIDELVDTIEAMRKHIEALQQENEQLQAQVAQYREALIIANHRMPDVGQFCACGKCKTCGADINYVGYEHCVKCARVIIDEALSGTPADYHNPGDVEALKQAREALTIVSDYYSNVLNMAAWKTVKEALAAIDKVIGGKEDV